MKTQIQTLTLTLIANLFSGAVRAAPGSNAALIDASPKYCLNGVYLCCNAQGTQTISPQSSSDTTKPTIVLSTCGTKKFTTIAPPDADCYMGPGGVQCVTYPSVVLDAVAGPVGGGNGGGGTRTNGRGGDAVSDEEKKKVMCLYFGVC